MDIHICPDCRDNKHSACVDQAWDEATETIVPCSCGCRDQK